VLLIGQSLECWRGGLADAVVERRAAPLLARAQRQLDAGAHTLDVNFGASPRNGLADDLRWAAEVLRAAHPDVPLFLDCGDLEVLASVVALVEGPLVLNAIPLDGPPTEATVRALDAAAARGAGIVFSPRAADGEDSPSAILGAAEEARTLAREAGIAGPLYLDCLAYPAASHPARCRRSLTWLHVLHTTGDSDLVPLVAAGNVGHGAFDSKRLLQATYVVLAATSGVQALLLRAEDSMLMSLLNVMEDRSHPVSDLERWAVEVASLPPDEALTLPPPAGEYRAAWDMLTS
jgi:hypothetical protein